MSELFTVEDKKELVHILGFYIHTLYSDICGLENKIRLLKSRDDTEARVEVYADKIDRQEAYAKKMKKLRKKIKEREQKFIVTMTEVENAVGDTSDEYTEGVVELFESKGFEVVKT